MAARLVATIIAALASGACTHRPLDLPSRSTTNVPDGDVVDTRQDLSELAGQDLSIPFPFSVTIGTGAPCAGWTINVSDRASTSCNGFGGTGINFVIGGDALGTYESVPTISMVCMPQSVWATYAGNDNFEIPMTGTLTVTKLKTGNNDDATIDGSYDMQVSGVHFVGDFHAVPCTF